MVTDTTERGLEALITNSLTSNGWLPGDPQDYERAHCVDLSHLSAFLSATSLKQRPHWTWTQIPPREEGSWTASNGRSPAGASSTYSGRASSTGPAR